VGNFLKRLCTVGWALTALIALALLAGSSEIAEDPDRVWGVAAREILGPLNLGLVGLMLACLLAAMMSSADTYMIVTSALVVRNVYAAYINPDADEKTYVSVGRITGLVIIVGAASVALSYADVFGQFKMAMELPIVFAAPFWLGMYWRRANRMAVWGTILASLLIFFVLPVALPALNPALRESPALATTTHVETRSFQRPATEADVARYGAWLDSSLGTPPPKAEQLGQPITIEMKSGGQPIYWRGGATTVDGSDPKVELVRERREGDVLVRVERITSPQIGQGSLNADLLLYSLLGFDLSGASRATLETLRLPARLLTPFLVLIVLSYVTPRNDQAVLNRYYAKMNTPVDPDPESDYRNLEQAYASPVTTASRKLFPSSDWEFVRPTAKDVIGFVVSCGVCAMIIGLLSWLASIGS
jgi:SSS family solute:Na+ symporter